MKEYVNEDDLFLSAPSCRCVRNSALSIGDATACREESSSGAYHGIDGANLSQPM